MHQSKALKQIAGFALGFKPPLLAGFLLALTLVGCGTSSDSELREPVETASHASDQLPNLRALPAKDLRLRTSGGRTFLRFSATTWNNGTGPLELRAGERVGTNKQNVYQRILQSDGTWHSRLAGTFVWHEAHNHFHFEDYAVYTLNPVNAPGASQRTSAKTTFCVMDTDQVNPNLAGAPSQAVYASCGSQVQGMSVGWGDTYGYYLTGQEIEVSTSGDYNLTIAADTKKRILESYEGDNSRTIRLRIDLVGGTVTRLY